jgi:hypothetical protein
LINAFALASDAFMIWSRRLWASRRLDVCNEKRISEAACLELAKHRECVGMENLDPDTLTPTAIDAFKKAWPDVWGGV